jgi:Holliday junction resolvasome RuvABC endonuclease subunit
MFIMRTMSIFRYLLAVDPSLTCSGWALFTVVSGGVSAVGKVRAGPPSLPMATRLAGLQSHIEELLETLELGSRDALVCEAPTTMRDPHNAIKVEQVRGIFEGAARNRGVKVPGRVNPRTVQYEVMGMTGKQALRNEVKAAAVRSVEYLYAPDLKQLGIEIGTASLTKHQDIVDAMLVGRVAVLRLQAAAQAGAPVEELFEGQANRSRRSWRVKSSGLS